MSQPDLPSKQPLDVVNSLLRESKWSDAGIVIEGLLQQDPQNAQYWHVKGKVAQHSGNTALAIEYLHKALQLNPAFKEACLDLAKLLDATSNFSLSVKIYEHWLKIEQSTGLKKLPLAKSNADKNAAQKWFEEGRRFQEKEEPEKAAASFRKVLKLYPGMTEALTNLAIALSSLRRFAEAEEALLTSIRIKPHSAPALLILGNCYKDTDQAAKAIACYYQTLAADPRHMSAAINIGRTYFEKNFDEAIKAYEHALTIDPESVEAISDLTYLSYRMCRWDEAEAARKRMEAMIQAERRPMGPFIVATMIPSAELQYKNAVRYASHAYTTSKPYDITRPLPSAARADGKLRIGYLSADFQDHATARLISELFEQHDRTRFEIYAYSHGKEDHVKEPRMRIRNAVDKFHDMVAMDDFSAIELIKKDGIDILVDLKGYTLDHRLSIAAQRPAPIQIHYLGFPGTLGANFIDYFISDPVASPPGSDALFSEALIRLPHSYQINDRKRALSQNALPRSVYGLPEEGFVFCDFNNAYKITPDIFGVWMRLLAAVPGSVLWLSEADSGATVNLREKARACNIDPARLVVAKTAPQAEHLQRYGHVDLFLDTSPVCGHTTASDALWCGVPVVTMPKESFISRVAASLLHAVGLPELVAADLVSYEAKALELALDKNKLQAVRKHLEEGRMTFPLFDATATARALEAAYIKAAKIHRGQTAPKPFAVLPDLTIV
jgi:predicted O-linked N-acetylglucosamine transferase (SPINDLY family)